MPAHEVGPAAVEERLGDRAGGAAARAREWSRMRCTAIACTGGWVIPEVCRARGACSGERRASPSARGRGSSRRRRWRTRCAGSSRCATAPTAGCRVRRRPARRSAGPARPRRTRRPSSTCAGTAAAPRVVIAPRSLPRSRYAARAASCVGAKLGSVSSVPFCGQARPIRLPDSGRVTRMAARARSPAPAAASAPRSPTRSPRRTPVARRPAVAAGSTRSPRTAGATTWPLDLADTRRHRGGRRPIERARRAGPQRRRRRTRAGSPSRRSTSGATTIEVNVVAAPWHSRWRCCRRCGPPAATSCSSTPAPGINALAGLGVVRGEQVRAASASPTSLRAEEPDLRVTAVYPGPHRHRHAARTRRLRGRALRSRRPS